MGGGKWFPITKAETFGVELKARGITHSIELTEDDKRSLLTSNSKGKHLVTTLGIQLAKDLSIKKLEGGDWEKKYVELWDAADKTEDKKPMTLECKYAFGSYANPFVGEAYKVTGFSLKKVGAPYHWGTVVATGGVVAKGEKETHCKDGISYDTLCLENWAHGDEKMNRNWYFGHYQVGALPDDKMTFSFHHAYREVWAMGGDNQEWAGTVTWGMTPVHQTTKGTPPHDAKPVLHDKGHERYWKPPLVSASDSEEQTGGREQGGLNLLKQLQERATKLKRDKRNVDIYNIGFDPANNYGLNDLRHNVEGNKKKETHENAEKEQNKRKETSEDTEKEDSATKENETRFLRLGSKLTDNKHRKRLSK